MLQVLNWIAAIVLALGGTFLLCILPDTAYGDEDVRLAPKDSAIARENKARAKNRAAVLVLGDIGRSPRMQNHVLSMAKAGLEVDFIGYVGMNKFHGFLYAVLLGKVSWLMSILRIGGTSCYTQAEICHHLSDSKGTEVSTDGQ